MTKATTIKIETPEDAEAVRASLAAFEKKVAREDYDARTKQFAKATELVQSKEYQKVRDQVSALRDDLDETALGVHLRPLASVLRNFERGLEGATRKPVILEDGDSATASQVQSRP